MLETTHNMLWQYLGNFTLYTLLSIGVIYAMFLYLRKNPASRNVLMRFGQPSLHAQHGKKLEIETVLTLEPRKNLYIVRADKERFLISTSMEGTQFLAKLNEKAGASDLEAIEAAGRHSTGTTHNNNHKQASAFAGYTQTLMSFFTKPYTNLT